MAKKITQNKIIEVPQNLLKVIESTSKRKDRRNNILKIYNAFLEQKRWTKYHGYFDVPSSYLKAVNDDYRRIIDMMIENRFIDVMSSSLSKESYDTKKQQCKSYKLLNYHNLVEVEFTDEFQSTKWYKIIDNSLISIGFYDNKIYTDKYGTRVYHPLSKEYKKVLRNQNFVSIDAHAAHTYLLFDKAKKEGFYDEKLENILLTTDFYQYLVENFVDKEGKPRYKDREKAKKGWQNLLYNKGTLFRSIYYIFPDFYKHIKEIKDPNDRFFSRRMQRSERKLFIDELLVKTHENLNIDFILPIHDSLIVKKEHEQNVLNYLSTLYPAMVFKSQDLK